MKLEYLNNHGRVVKKCVIRAESSEQLDAYIGIVKSNMFTLGGILIYQKKISEISVFFIY